MGPSERQAVAQSNNNEAQPLHTDKPAEGQASEVSSHSDRTAARLTPRQRRSRSGAKRAERAAIPPSNSEAHPPHTTSRQWGQASEASRPASEQQRRSPTASYEPAWGPARKASRHSAKPAAGEASELSRHVGRTSATHPPQATSWQRTQANEAGRPSVEYQRSSLTAERAAIQVEQQQDSPTTG